MKNTLISNKKCLIYTHCLNQYSSLQNNLTIKIDYSLLNMFDSIGSQLQLIMGKQSSKIKDILYVTGADLDPPQTKLQKKYNPTKQIKFDYGGFKPKKYYKTDATEQQILQHQKKLKKKQDILKLFKYHKQFDRINFHRMMLNVAPFEIYLEQSFKIAIVTSLVMGRLIQVQFLNEYLTVAGSLKFAVPLFLMSIPVILHRSLTSPEYHIVNHEYFRLTDSQISLFQQYHYELDYYKDVDDIKYNFKYPSVRQFYKTKRQVLDQGHKAQKAQFREYFEYYNKLKFDKYEQFIKLRQQNRKSNQIILTPEQKQYIQAELKMQKTII